MFQLTLEADSLAGQCLHWKTLPVEVNTVLPVEEVQSAVFPAAKNKIQCFRFFERDFAMLLKINFKKKKKERTKYYRVALELTESACPCH